MEGCLQRQPLLLRVPRLSLSKIASALEDLKTIAASGQRGGRLVQGVGGLLLLLHVPFEHLAADDSAIDIPLRVDANAFGAGMIGLRSTQSPR